MLNAPASRALLLLALAFAPAACGVRQTLSAPSTTLGPVQVRVTDAYTLGPRVGIKAVVVNNSGKAVSVDPSGLDLRVGGKLLPHRAGMLATHKPVTVQPGQKQEISVEFRADHDLDDVTKAALLVGGVSAPADAPAKVLGEIVLSASQ